MASGFSFLGDMSCNIVDAACVMVSQLYPRKKDKFIQYGTAGFRTRADDLPHVICRMGLLAILRSKQKRAVIGVMITASHNPEEDNGVKLIDPLGEMLEMKWEKHATTLANVRDLNLPETLTSILKEEKINLSVPAEVFIARDTRASGRSLVEALDLGIEALDGASVNFGLLTTPQLHYLVRCKNTGLKYGKCSEKGYYKKLSKAFIELQNRVTDTKQYSDSVYIDTANGVGAEKVELLSKHLGETLTITLCNDGTTGKLNHNCGADYVKVGQCAPEGIEMRTGQKYVSFDGDADRVVYFFQGTDKVFHLMDGDRIATLVAGHLMELVQASGLDLNLGLVQTAYANGSSTNYIKNTLRVPVVCAATGVKHLHHKALDFDIGVYFEANGHGTVLFNNDVEDTIKDCKGPDVTPEQKDALEILLTTINLINQTVGDAMSDMLLVEVILRARGWSIADWYNCYQDLPNRQLKIKVKDRTVIETTADETRATSPRGMQVAINKLVQKYTSARSFVRPSGTEDVVRVYAEADTQEAADKLASEVGLVVYTMAGGVEDKPSPP